MFQKPKCNVLLQNKQLAAPTLVLVKVVEVIKKSDFPLFFSTWFALLIFQPCCGTDLREISIASSK